MTTSPPRPRRQATRGAAKLLLATVSAAGIIGGWAVISRVEAAATSVPMTLVSAPPAPIRGPLPAILVPPAAIAEVPGVAGRPAAPPLELPPIPELTAPLPTPAVAPEASDENERAETAAPRPLVPAPTSVPRAAARAQSPSEPNQQPAASAAKPPVPAAVPPAPAGPAPKPAAPPPPAPAPAPKPAAPPPAAPAPAPAPPAPVPVPPAAPPPASKPAAPPPLPPAAPPPAKPAPAPPPPPPPAAVPQPPVAAPKPPPAPAPKPAGRSRSSR